MEFDKTCRHCSTARVNALCRLYNQAYGENQAQSLINLKALVQLARERGYIKSTQVLRPGLRSDEVRTLAWNISSVLRNQDLDRLGIPLDDNGRGRPQP